MNLMDYRILVTPASVGRHDPLLREQLETAVGEVIYNPNPR